MSAVETPPWERRSKTGEPVWELANRWPLQGEWTEDDYFRLCPERGVEFVDGHLEFLPVPTKLHQVILLFLLKRLDDHLSRGAGGLLLPAGYRIRVGPTRYREPDLVYFLPENVHRCQEEFADTADLAMEIVSKDRPNRDLIHKRAEYAKAGIREYWLVDPRDSTITVLKLVDGEYVVHSAGGAGQTVASNLLPGFTVEVAAAFTVP